MLYILSPLYILYTCEVNTFWMHPYAWIKNTTQQRKMRIYEVLGKFEIKGISMWKS